MTMANTDDRDLLRAYAQEHDAQAFAQLVRRYAGLVYSAARRVTGNAADAEDVSQRTFFQLASWAGALHGSTAAWLHATATRQAVSLIRSEFARKEREQARMPPASSPDWSQIEPLVDDAISRLPDELRECLLLHYLQGVPQSDVAQHLGVDQSTISRRISKALAQLRNELAAAGVTAPAAPAFTAMLLCTDAPASLVQSLLKIGLVPAPGCGVAGAAGAVGGGALAKSMAVAIAIVVAGLTVGIYLVNRGTSMSAQSTSVAPPQWAVGFRGDIYRQDSFTLAMQAVARHMGKDPGYDDLLALSGNAFAPAFRPDEPERSFWAIQGGGRNIDLVCRRLGLICRPFPRPENLGQTIAPKPADPAAIKAWEFDSYRKPVIAAIREATARGETILSMGEFLNENGATWTEWGIVTEARDDGTILGAASNGRLDNRIDFIRDGWFIGVDKAGPQLTKEQAQREVLRRAAMRIRGDVVVKTETYGRNIAYGVPAVNAWIAAMDQADFCTHCQDDARCARDIALPVYGEAQAAERWLAQTGIPAAREAAGHYRRIAQSLEPFATEDGAMVSPTDAIQLNGVTYLVEPLKPGRQLADLPRGESVGPYADHLMPYYNIHCELADEPNDALDARIRKLGISYEQYWQRLPTEKLSARPLAVLATTGGRLVGYIRFYPADRAALRNLKDRQDSSADTLLIGGCAFTLDALNAGLDRALFKRITAEARRSGYRRIQAVAWPDARAFAMWGEGLQRRVYEDEGFSSLAVEPADAAAFTDICSGAHGEEVRKLAREDVPPNIALGPLGELHLMQLDLPEQTSKGYAAVIGDVAKQQEHARTVLRRVKEQLLAAATALEAAELQGVNVRYEDVYCLGGNAFSPMADLWDNCNAWWHVEAWLAVAGFDNVGRHYGLDLRALPAPSGTPQDNLRKARMANALNARAHGATILCLGGFQWQVDGPKAFISGKWAGVVRNIDPPHSGTDESITGLSFNGRSDNWVVDSGYLFALGRTARPPISDRDAQLAMLRLAVARWQSQPPFAGTDKELYGRRAVDAWINRMENNPGFCEACTKRGTSGCARPNAVAARHGAATASAYLRQIAPSYATVTQASLLSAVGHYDRIVALLAPFTTSDAYQPILGDLPLQRKHAQEVLVPMRAEYAAAADAMQKAADALGKE